MNFLRSACLAVSIEFTIGLSCRWLSWFILASFYSSTFLTFYISTFKIFGSVFYYKVSFFFLSERVTELRDFREELFFFCYYKFTSSKTSFKSELLIIRPRLAEFLFFGDLKSTFPIETGIVSCNAFSRRVDVAFKGKVSFGFIYFGFLLLSLRACERWDSLELW